MAPPVGECQAAIHPMWMGWMGSPARDGKDTNCSVRREDGGGEGIEARFS